MEEKPEKIPSSQEPPQEQSQSEIKKEKSPIPIFCLTNLNKNKINILNNKLLYFKYKFLL